MITKLKQMVIKFKSFLHKKMCNRKLYSYQVNACSLCIDSYWQ